MTDGILHCNVQKLLSEQTWGLSIVFYFMQTWMGLSGAPLLRTHISGCACEASCTVQLPSLGKIALQQISLSHHCRKLLTVLLPEDIKVD